MIEIKEARRLVRLSGVTVLTPEEVAQLEELLSAVMPREPEIPEMVEVSGDGWHAGPLPVEDAPWFVDNCGTTHRLQIITLEQ